MSQQTINVGNAANDDSGDPLRTAYEKINDNFDELYVATGLDEEEEEGVVRNVLTGTKSWTTGAVAAGAFAGTQVTVTGAAAGNTAIASLTNAMEPGIFLAAHVYTTNVVQVTLVNLTNDEIDLSIVTLNVDVFY